MFLQGIAWHTNTNTKQTLLECGQPPSPPSDPLTVLIYNIAYTVYVLGACTVSSSFDNSKTIARPVWLIMCDYDNL